MLISRAIADCAKTVNSLQYIHDSVALFENKARDLTIVD